MKIQIQEVSFTTLIILNLQKDVEQNCLEK